MAKNLIEFLAASQKRLISPHITVIFPHHFCSTMIRYLWLSTYPREQFGDFSSWLVVLFMCLLACDKALWWSYVAEEACLYPYHQEGKWKRKSWGRQWPHLLSLDPTSTIARNKAFNAEAFGAFQILFIAICLNTCCFTMFPLPVSYSINPLVFAPFSPFFLCIALAYILFLLWEFHTWIQYILITSSSFLLLPLGSLQEASFLLSCPFLLGG